MMVRRTVILIVTCVWLSLVEGSDSSRMEKKNETTPDAGRRILYGERADVSKFRFLVELRNTAYPCAGTIVSMHWILTAADCVRGIDCGDIQIYPLAWPHPQNVYASTCSYHERHILLHTDYNIGMIKVDPELVEANRATNAQLPLPGTRFPKGTAALFPGWGATENKVILPHLQEVPLRLDDWEVCNRAYRENMLSENCKEGQNCRVPDVAARLLCAQGEGPVLPSPCLGDLGGPLVLDGRVIGIASMILRKDGYCAFGAPFMFTSVVDYLPWIDRHIDPSYDTSKIVVNPEHEYNPS